MSRIFSGQVSRSVFNVQIQNKLLSRTPVQDRKKGGGSKGDHLHWRVQGLIEFGMSRRIKPKEKYVRISVKEIWRNLEVPPKNKEL